MENSTICMWGRTKGREQWCRVSNVSIFSPRILYIHGPRIYTPDPGIQRSPYIFEDSTAEPRFSLDYSLSKFIKWQRAWPFDVVSRVGRKLFCTQSLSQIISQFFFLSKIKIYIFLHPWTNSFPQKIVYLSERKKKCFNYACFIVYQRLFSPS